MIWIAPELSDWLEAKAHDQNLNIKELVVKVLNEYRNNQACSSEAT